MNFITILPLTFLAVAVHAGLVRSGNSDSGHQLQDCPRDPYQLYLDNYCHEINKGSYGLVCVVSALNKADKHEYVLKWPKSAVKSYSVADEIKIHRKIKKELELPKNPPIVLSECDYIPPKNDEYRDDLPWISFKYYPRGDLQEYKKRLGRNFNFEEIRSFGRDILNGLKLLHDGNFALHDLKLENVVAYKDESPNGSVLRAKIIDLAFVRHATYRTFSGSSQYMSPEKLLLRANEGKELFESGKPADMWAFGSVLLFAFRGTFVFYSKDTTISGLTLDYLRQLAAFKSDIDESETLADDKKRILRAHIQSIKMPDFKERSDLDCFKLDERFEDCKKLVDLILKLLRVSQADRLTVEEALAHPFFSQQ